MSLDINHDMYMYMGHEEASFVVTQEIQMLEDGAVSVIDTVLGSDAVSEASALVINRNAFPNIKKQIIKRSRMVGSPNAQAASFHAQSFFTANFWM